MVASLQGQLDALSTAIGAEFKSGNRDLLQKSTRFSTKVASAFPQDD
jgi:hypothetical protein